MNRVFLFVLGGLENTRREGREQLAFHILSCFWIGEIIMAHKESVQNDDIRQWLSGERFIWTNSERVGYGYRNRLEDVMLVQFLVNGAFRAGKKLYNWHSKNVPSELVIDGKFGGKTWKAIKMWQEMVTGVVVDGMISPSDGTKALTPRQGQIYTILTLNVYYRDGFPIYYQDISSDPTMRPELAVHLMKLGAW